MASVFQRESDDYTIESSRCMPGWDKQPSAFGRPSYSGKQKPRNTGFHIVTNRSRPASYLTKSTMVEQNSLQQLRLRVRQLMTQALCPENDPSSSPLGCACRTRDVLAEESFEGEASHKMQS